MRARDSSEPNRPLRADRNGRRRGASFGQLGRLRGDTGVSPPQAERPFRLTLTAGVSFDYELTKLLPGTAKCADEVYGRCPPGRPLPGD